MLEKTKTELIETTAPIPQVGFHLLSSKVLDLTPEVVKEFRQIEATPTERLLNDKRVEHLNDKIDSGLCVTFHWVTAELNGKLRRINGQHSSTALAQRCMLVVDGNVLVDENRWPKGLKVHREHYAVDNDEWLVMLFRQFDDRASGRSPLDVSGAYQGLYPELYNVDRKIAKLAIDGYIWYTRNVEGVPVAMGDDVYSKFKDHGLYPMIQWLNELLVGRCSEMKVPSVIAAVVGTYMVNESSARDFWNGVVNLADGADDSSPPALLSQWLLQIKAGKVAKPRPANIYQGCISAWNAYRAGKGLVTIRDEIKKNFFVIHE